MPSMSVRFRSLIYCSSLRRHGGQLQRGDDTSKVGLRDLNGYLRSTLKRYVISQTQVTHSVEKILIRRF